MKLEHYYVNLVDLPEVLPFTLSDGLEGDGENEERRAQELFAFMEALEAFDSIHYIGQDNIEGRFYQRFLFDGGGFIEVMQKAPAAIVAHFAAEQRAEAFVETLQTVVKDRASDAAAGSMMADDIKVSKDVEGSISYEKWAKLNTVRESLGD